jgi:AcrR family transcriptional regulator
MARGVTGSEESSAPGVRLEGFREPRQERSRRTLDRIAGATEALLSERGAGDLTVEDVVARADTSVGAFYTRFDGKRVAVAYVRQRSWGEARRMWCAFLAPEDWEEVPIPAVVCEVVRQFARVLLAGGRPTRALYLDLLRREDEAGLERVRQLDREIAGLVGRLLEARSGKSGGVTEGRAVREGFLRVISGLRDHLLFGARGEERSLILRLTQMYAALLGVKRPGSYAELLALCAEAR